MAVENHKIVEPRAPTPAPTAELNRLTGRLPDDLLSERVDGRVARAVLLPLPVGEPRVETHALDVGPRVGRGLELPLTREEPAAPPPQLEHPDLGRHTEGGLLGPITHPSFDERERVAGEVERFERPREAAHAADRSARTVEIDAVEVATGRARAVAREDDRTA